MQNFQIQDNGMMAGLILQNIDSADKAVSGSNSIRMVLGAERYLRFMQTKNLGVLLLKISSLRGPGNHRRSDSGQAGRDRASGKNTGNPQDKNNQSNFFNHPKNGGKNNGDEVQV